VGDNKATRSCDGDRAASFPLAHAPGLQGRSGRLELGIGLGTDGGHGPDTDDDDQSEHHRVLNGRWTIFRNQKILHTGHELVHRFLFLNTKPEFRTRNQALYQPEIVDASPLHCANLENLCTSKDHQTPECAVRHVIQAVSMEPRSKENDVKFVFRFFLGPKKILQNHSSWNRNWFRTGSQDAIPRQTSGIGFVAVEKRVFEGAR